MTLRALRCAAMLLVAANAFGASQVVRTPGSNAVRLHFSDLRLGPAATIRVTSTRDGATQVLDRRSLALWSSGSAYFNGDEVVVDFFDAEGRVTPVKDLVTSPPANTAPATTPASRDVCGTIDHRVSSADPGVARVMPTGCTTWHVTSGAFLTAGHCNDNGIAVIQYDVPPSQCDGTPVHPPPSDQYPVDPASIVTQRGARVVGNDYAIFRVLPNGTSAPPPQTRGDFFRPTLVTIADGTPVRITGFGASVQPVGCTGSKNALSQTQQTEPGPFGGYDITAPAVASIQYHVDTSDGNSGSPATLNGTRTTLGVHTTGGCAGSPTTFNAGTAFANVELQQALQTFFGSSVVHVDTGTVAPTATGTLFEPFVTISDALAAAPAGATISIAPGSYERTLRIVTPVTVTAPVGTVTIGARDGVTAKVDPQTPTAYGARLLGECISPPED